MVRATRRPAVVALVAAFLVTILPGGAAQPVLAAGTISLAGIDVPYTQDFDTLALSGTSSTVPNGWDFSESGTNANTTYTAGTGSSNAGDTYSFGAAASTDRALGGLLSGSLVPTIGASFTNDTGTTLTTLEIAYTGEQWRIGTLGRTDRLDFQLSTNATSLTTGTWSDHDTLDFTAPVTTGALGARDGNAAPNRTAIAGTIGDLSIANGATFWIRWTDFNAAGADDGLAVDDFSLTPRLSAGDAAPTVASTSPTDGATSVPVDATVSVTFSEPVTLDAGALSLACDPSGPAASVDSGPATTFEFLLLGDLPEGASCTITVDGSKVHDVDEDDPPDTMDGTFTATFTVFAPVSHSTDVKISQVYGGGGNSGADYKNDFIELFNRGATDVDLTGWSVQYASSAGSSWQVTPLGAPTAAIPAGKHYLIQEAAGNSGTVDLPDPDAVGTIAMSATNGKVALVASTTALSGTCPSSPDVVDFVGYGSANCFEGTAAVPTLSNTTAALRNGDGAIDTDHNIDDFTVGDPNPRASKDSAPRVASSFPADGAAGVPVWANLTITFSEPVDVTGAWYDIDCATSGTHAATVTGGPTSFTLDPVATFAGGETCQVTIVAANVTDVDTDDPPDTMAADATISFTVAEDSVCGDPATLISAVQGDGPTSPMQNQVVEIEGVVVGAYPGSNGLQGFHVQEEDADQDGNPATSEGIFIFDPNGGATYAVGDLVRIKGRVTEFVSSGQPLTELTNLNNLVVCSSGHTVTPASVSLPFPSPEFPERYESMLVTIDQELTVTETFTLGRFGEVVLSSGGRLFTPTNVVEPGAPAIALQAANDLRRIVLDDGDSRQNLDPTLYPTGGLSATNTLRIGDTTQGGTFVFEQRFGVYRLQPTAVLPTFQATNPRPVTPPDVGGDLKAASFNVLNYFDTIDLGAPICGPAEDQECRGADSVLELERQRAKIVAALAGLDADIVGLLEIENDPGSAVADLVAGLNDVAGPGTYAYINTSTIGTDAIKVALIFKPSAVTPVGAHAILDSSVDPRFDDTRSRPALAQTFDTVDGGRFTVVVNHLKSKGSACSGDPDTGDGQGNCNITRTLAAEALVDWIASDPTGSGDRDALVIGDLNAYAKEDPIDVFVEAGYTNLVEQFGGAEAYSYVFQGQSGYLDHALASPTLAAQVTGAVDWHINADEPIVLDYNVEFKSPGHVDTLFAPDAYRSSDHDPVLVGMDLLHFGFEGFGPPVAEPPARTEANAGSTIPMNFTLSGASGLDVLFDNPVSRSIDCDTSAPTGPWLDTTSAAGLSFDPRTEIYTYPWKTLKQWSRTCRTFELTLDDGAYRTAEVFFRK